MLLFSRQFGLFYDHLVYFVAIWYILSRLGMLRQKIWQSGINEKVLLSQILNQRLKHLSEKSLSFMRI
jgi:hypothetical protein